VHVHRLCTLRPGEPAMRWSAGWCRGSRPVSRLLFPGARGGGHPSGTGVAAGLVRSTRGLGRASLHGRVAAAGTSPIRPCSGWGLPSRPVTRPLVRSYRTVSPLPVRSRGPAVCSLWHFPAGRPDWRLASTLPCGGRTFLDPARRRDRGRPAGSPCPASMPPAAGPAGCSLLERSSQVERMCDNRNMKLHRDRAIRAVGGAKPAPELARGG
jgi:hypothetical protein